VKPWRTASRKQIAQWIRDAAFSALIESYDAMIDDKYDAFQAHRLEEGWSREDCDEFVKTFKGEIHEAIKHLDAWLDAED